MPLLKICFCLLRHAAITFHSKSANHAVARPTDLWQLEVGSVNARVFGSADSDQLVFGFQPKCWQEDPGAAYAWTIRL